MRKGKGGKCFSLKCCNELTRERTTICKMEKVLLWLSCGNDEVFVLMLVLLFVRCCRLFTLLVLSIVHFVVVVDFSRFMSICISNLEHKSCPTTNESNESRSPPWSKKPKETKGIRGNSWDDPIPEGISEIGTSGKC